MGGSSEHLLDQYVALFTRMGEQAEQHVPYGASIFYSTLAAISAFSILVFLTDSLTQFTGLQLPFLIHGLVYLIPIGFALAGWHRGREERSNSRGAQP